VSRQHEEPITCPGCGRRSTFTTWSSLNATLDPDQKPRLLSGELTRFTCPACGHSAEVSYPLLYHDMERQLMLWHVPDASVKHGYEAPGELPAAMRKTLGAGYRFRRVGTLNSLREKVLIFDHDLDDRVVEVLKLLVVAQAPSGKIPTGADVYFSEIVREDDGSNGLAFTIVSEKGSSGAILPMGMYQKVAADLARGLAQPPDGSWPVIDSEFAFRLFSSAEKSRRRAQKRWWEFWK
jgi:hypothetical protein